MARRAWQAVADNGLYTDRRVAADLSIEQLRGNTKVTPKRSRQEAGESV